MFGKKTEFLRMLDIGTLLALADIYCVKTGTKPVTLSFWMFNDSKKLAALCGGADVTTGRFNAAMQWLSDNWPEGAEWPADVARPEKAEAAE